MAHRYFTHDIAGDIAHITGTDARHLAQVLRAQPGAPLTLCDGNGTDFEAVILTVTAQQITLRVLSAAPSKAEPLLWAEACIGIAKGERMDWAVQKAVELGASVIRPFYSEHSVVKPKKESEKAARWGRIALEAAKQSGRGIIPTVEQPVLFPEMLAAAAQCDAAFLFYEGGGQPLRQLVQNQKKLALITGPEGGFSTAEVEEAGLAGCVTVGLGPRILRSETAPAAALAVVMALSGNLE